MKKVDLKNRKSLLRGTVTGLAMMLVASVLLTGCGTRRSAGGAYDNAGRQSPAYELSDDCALLHIYRPGSMAGMAISYQINLDDEPLFRVKNKSKTTVRVTSEGLKTLWAKTETREELPIEIQFGNEYYVRCGIGLGAFVGRPRIELVPGKTGKAEFDKIPFKK